MGIDPCHDIKSGARKGKEIETLLLAFGSFVLGRAPFFPVRTYFLWQ